METDFSDIIVNFVRQAEPDLDFRLESQAEALADLTCTNRTLGKWIDEYDVEYLFAAFELDDQDFAENFPKLAHVTHHDRARIMKTFEDHFANCSHCYRKRGFDLELNARIDLACRQSKVQSANHQNQDDPKTSVEPPHSHNGVATAATATSATMQTVAAQEII